MSKPEIVCLCGSTRFMDAFHKANFEHTLAGRIVLTVGCDTKQNAGGLVPADKERLDELHLRKIDLADFVYVLNVDGYVGSSLEREIAYTIALGKRLVFLEPELGEKVLEERSHKIGKLVAGFVK